MDTDRLRQPYNKASKRGKITASKKSMHDVLLREAAQCPALQAIIDEAVEESKDVLLLSRPMAARRATIAKKYIDVKSRYPELMNAWDPDGLIERACFFLGTYATIGKGRNGGKITYQTLFSIRWDMLYLMWINSGQGDRSLAAEWEARTLTYSHDLVSKLGLPLGRVTERNAIGLSETSILVQTALYKPRDVDNAIQKCFLIVLFLFLGCRPGSLMRTKYYKGKADLLLFRDIKVFKEDRNMYRLVIELRNWKGFRSGRGLDKQLVYQLRAVLDVDYLHVDPAILLMALAIRRGALKGINTVKDLEDYDKREIHWKEGFMDRPVFAASKPKGCGVDIDTHMSYNAWSDYFSKLLIDAGLDGKGVSAYSFRYGMARNTVQKLGEEKARRAMGHNPESKTLEGSYLDAQKRMDFVGLILDDYLDETWQITDSNSIIGYRLPFRVTQDSIREEMDREAHKDDLFLDLVGRCNELEMFLANKNTNDTSWKSHVRPDDILDENTTPREYYYFLLGARKRRLDRARDNHLRAAVRKAHDEYRKNITFAEYNNASALAGSVGEDLVSGIIRQHFKNCEEKDDSFTLDIYMPSPESTLDGEEVMDLENRRRRYLRALVDMEHADPEPTVYTCHDCRNNVYVQDELRLKDYKSPYDLDRYKASALHSYPDTFMAHSIMTDLGACLSVKHAKWSCTFCTEGTYSFPALMEHIHLCHIERKDEKVLDAVAKYISGSHNEHVENAIKSDGTTSILKRLAKFFPKKQKTKDQPAAAPEGLKMQLDDEDPKNIPFLGDSDMDRLADFLTDAQIQVLADVCTELIDGLVDIGEHAEKLADCSVV